MEFTPEELKLLHMSVDTRISDYEGVATTDEEMDALRALAAKIERLQLIGKRVHFKDEDGAGRVGELRGFTDYKGKTVAEIACEGFIYLVDPVTELVGEA